MGAALRKSIHGVTGGQRGRDRAKPQRARKWEARPKLDQRRARNFNQKDQKSKAPGGDGVPNEVWTAPG